MKFSTYSSIFLLICLQISIIPQAKSQFSYDFRFIDSFCTNSSTFALSSTYNSSINAVLDSFTSNATANSIGYYSNSFGNTSENTVHGYFLCRGDLDNDDCHTCVSTVVRERRTTPGAKCPASKRETIYYTKCMLRYSNTILYGKLVTDVVKVQENPDKLAENQGDFRKLVVDMFRGMVSKAANNQTGKKYAATAGTFPGSITLYATLQCTPDLSAVDCNSCLMFAITSLKARTNGENFMTPSCNIRYEIYPFFNGAADLLLSAPPEASTTSPRKSKILTGAIIGIVVATTIVAVFIAIGVCLIKKRKVVKENDNVYNIHGEDLTVESLQYELSSLQSSTNNFSIDNKLGEGGFGIVYKGTLWNGQDIAVKRLTRSANQGEQEFKNEMLLVAKLQHRNLVRVLGFCLTETEKLLIYEYVPNKSLDKFLFDSENRKQLDWKRRYKIIVGIARGMLYLHEDSRLKIIHRDLKASNVLLDEDMNPKVSDFGTAKIFEVDQTRGSTNRVVGTHGYMAPEYVMNGTFSVKSDVYSFGILVLEIISGRRAYGFFEEDGEPDLKNFAWKHWRDNTPIEFVDPCIREQSPVDEVIRCMNIGLLSVQDADQRPSMSTIVLMLSSSSTTTPVPTEPTQFVLSNAKKDVNSDHSTKDSTPEYTNSGDDISLTLLR